MPSPTYPVGTKRICKICGYEIMFRGEDYGWTHDPKMGINPEWVPHLAEPELPQAPKCGSGTKPDPRASAMIRNELGDAPLPCPSCGVQMNEYHKGDCSILLGAATSLGVFRRKHLGVGPNTVDLGACERPELKVAHADEDAGTPGPGAD